MKKFKSFLMAGVTAGMLMTSGTGMAGGSWLGAGMSAFGTLYTSAMLFFNGGDNVWMKAPNFDAIQIVLEGGVLAQMFLVKDEWEPEPADEYQQAAADNGGSSGGGGSPGGVSLDLTPQTLPFKVASLKNVGIEAIGVGPSLGEIATKRTRTKIFEGLSFVQLKESAGTTKETDNKTPGAGDCSASYSVCLRDMKSAEEEAVIARQQQNEQNFATAGVAHAELGLMSVQQAMANDKSSLSREEMKASVEKIRKEMENGKAVTAQDLSTLIGTDSNTVAAMKIVSLMNLELAQRLNQGNMMQGATLTAEAARALTQTAKITD